MNGTRQDFLDVVKKEVGTKEGPGGATKYGKWDGYQGVAWCGQFVSWCLEQAGVPGDWKGEDSQRYTVDAVRRWRNKERVVKNPRAGDLVFFDWPSGDFVDHIGVVADTNEWDHGIVRTIEGNTNDGVHIRRRYRKDIMAFARPAFKKNITDEERLKKSKVTLYKGIDNHKSLVKALQRVVAVKDDGLFGDRTKQAVQGLQKRNNLKVDGVVGPLTKRVL